jgi:hypothetical protein
MPAYNFQSRFAAKVESGEKRQTIRASLRGAEVGKVAHLYTGQRTKQCRKLGQATITAVTVISFSRDKSGESSGRVFVTGASQSKQLSFSELDALAKADGFDSAGEMVAWFESQHSLPFVGFLIQWEFPKEVRNES